VPDTTPPPTSTPVAAPAAHRPTIRSTFTSWLLAAVEGTVEHHQGTARSALFGSARGTVVDLGSGNGATFRHLPHDIELHAVEPNPRFHARLRRTAARQGRDVVVHTVPGEAIDLPDGTADTVVCSWVLCTVADPSVVLAEIRRILRPGGRLLVVEHVAAPAGTATAAVQRLLSRPWRWLFEGCNLRRDTETAIRDAGFRDVRLEVVTMRGPAIPMRPQLIGSAVR
jgi:SAM-dependent methyltransferase